MIIEDGKIKPCNKCLRARQRLKDMAALLTPGGIGIKTLVETTEGDLIIENATRKIIEVTNEDHRGYIGTTVYLAGRQILDRTAVPPKTIKALGSIIRTTKLSQ